MQHAATYSAHVPQYMDKLPCAKHAWPDVVDIIKSARQSLQSMNKSHDFVELELRWGRREHGFQPGVTKEAFDALEARFDTGRDWAKKTQWHNISVFFHTSNLPGDHRKLRTEITFFPEDHPETKRVECTYKETVCNHDYRTVALASANPSAADLRIALNIEHAIPESDIPEICEPTLVHLKTRKLYYYAPTGYEQPVWCYVLTKRWVGRTLLDAKRAQATEPPVYEIELECLNPEYLSAFDPGQVAAKLLFKACDVLEIIRPMDRSDFVIEPIKNSMLWSRNKCV